MAITLRQTSTDPTGKSSALTHQEMNDNLKSYYQSSSLSGSTLELHTVSDTHSIDLSSLGGGSSVDISALNTFSGSAESRLDSIEAVTSSYLVPADTGSVYISSSVDQNRITFTQGNGSTQTLVIETGSADDSITYFTESISGTTATWTTSYELAEITSDCNRVTLAAGSPATIAGTNSAIIGGSNNYVACHNSVILAANVGIVCSQHSAVIGGVSNCVTEFGNNSVVVGGQSNKVNANSSIGYACRSAIVGGCNNCITCHSSVILGTEIGTIRSGNSAVIGGSSNRLCLYSQASVIAGGNNNIITGDNTSGLSSNTSAIIGGNFNNIERSDLSSIFGSSNSDIDGGLCSTIVGARYSRICAGGAKSTIVGGCGNVITGECSLVLGGLGALVQGDSSVALSSENVTLSGNCSLVFSPTPSGLVEARDNVALFDVSLLEVSGALSASGLVYPTTDGTAGQVIVTDGSGVLSFASVSGSGGEAIDTGSFYVSSSINGTAITFLQGDGTTEVVNIPAGGIDTGSFYVSSSVDRNTITFTQGDGTVESVTIETGSADDVITEWVESVDGGNSKWTSTTPMAILTGTSNRVVVGATNSTISSDRAVVLGGNTNSIGTHACHSAIVGGQQHCIFSTSVSAHAQYSSIVGGFTNCIVGSMCAHIIGSACSNIRTTGSVSSIIGSWRSNINQTSQCSGIVASSDSTINGNSGYVNIVGGHTNRITNGGCVVTIVGGCNNVVDGGCYSTILGGYSHTHTTSCYSSILAGCNNNTTSSDKSVILGGESNRLQNSDNSAIVGGATNRITSTSSRNIILGGATTTIGSPATYSTLINSRNTTLTGQCSLVFSPSTTTVTEDRNNIVRLDTSLLEVSGALSASGLVYPTTDGTAGQVITTDGSGVLSFASAGGGASTLVGLTDTNISALPSTGSYLYWNGAEWLDDNTNHTLGIQDSNTLINVATPNSNDVILFEQGEGLAISYDTNTVTFDIDLDWSSSYVDATQASSVWDAQGTGTDINAVLQAKGTGATVAQVPDGATTGGASRGTYATDFQKQRSNPNQVASGANSVIVGGSCNRAYGAHSSVLGGQENTAGGTFSSVLGGYQSCVGSSGTYSAALGNRAQVNAVGSFLFKDGSGTTPYVLTDNNTAAFVASKFYVEGTHEVSGSSFSSVGSPSTTATSPTTVAVSFDADDHNFFELTLAASTTHTIAIANGQPGQTIIIKMVQPSSGTPGLVSWTGSTNIKEAFDSDNNVTSLNSAEDIFTLVRFGTDWYLNAIKRFS